MSTGVQATRETIIHPRLIQVKTAWTLFIQRGQANRKGNGKGVIFRKAFPHVCGFASFPRTLYNLVIVVAVVGSSSEAVLLLFVVCCWGFCGGRCCEKSCEVWRCGTTPAMAEVCYGVDSFVRPSFFSVEVDRSRVSFLDFGCLE